MKEDKVVNPFDIRDKKNLAYFQPVFTPKALDDHDGWACKELLKTMIENYVKHMKETLDVSVFTKVDTVAGGILRMLDNEDLILSRTICDLGSYLNDAKIFFKHD